MSEAKTIAEMILDHACAGRVEALVAVEVIRDDAGAPQFWMHLTAPKLDWGYEESKKIQGALREIANLLHDKLAKQISNPGELPSKQDGATAAR